MSNVSHYLLLDKIEIDNANSLSSPITYGFPAISGFAGAMHALNRKLREHDWPVSFGGVLIACHALQVQRYRPHRYADYSFNQSRNPIKKDGSTAAIIEEGKCHFTVSLVVEINARRALRHRLEDEQIEFEQLCRQLLLQQRIAGGSTRTLEQVSLLDVSEEKTLKRQLLPAFVLMDARKELIEITEELQQLHSAATALDALLEVATLYQVPETKPNGKVKWQTRSAKTGRGWLVPMPVGFQAIAPQQAAGELAQCRTNDYPSQYVETLYSLGKWVFPHRLPASFSNCFWHYQQQPELYLFSQNPSIQGE